MKKDTKIFITCLVVGMWSLNLGMVQLRKVHDLSVDSALGVGAMALGVLLFAYGLMKHGDD